MELLMLRLEETVLSEYRDDETVSLRDWVGIPPTGFIEAELRPSPGDDDEPR